MADRMDGRTTPGFPDRVMPALERARLSPEVRAVIERGIAGDPSLAPCAADVLMAIACDASGWAGVSDWLAPASLVQRNVPIEILQGDFSMIRYLRDDILERIYLRTVVEHALGQA